MATQQRVFENHLVLIDKVRVFTELLFQIITLEHDCILSRCLHFTSVLESFMARLDGVTYFEKAVF